MWWLRPGQLRRKSEMPWPCCRCWKTCRPHWNWWRRRSEPKCRSDRAYWRRFSGWGRNRFPRSCWRRTMLHHRRAKWPCRSRGLSRHSQGSHRADQMFRTWNRNRACPCPRRHPSKGYCSRRMPSRRRACRKRPRPRSSRSILFRSARRCSHRRRRQSYR